MEEQEYYIVRKVPREEYMKHYIGKSGVKEKLLNNLSDEKYLLLQKVDKKIAMEIFKQGGCLNE